MEKIPFNITASKQEQTAFIRITGTIGWDTDCELFRARIDTLAKDGISKAHLYLNGPGGSVFDAEEIVNILTERFGTKITGEGGALVASAYTRIAMICESFIMPENGMFMVHKPSGGAYGTVNEIESYLKVLRTVEAQYVTAYKKKSTNAQAFDKEWEKGDWWMTAKEAKENGFITDVRGNEKIDASTTALITACGCPVTKIPTITITNQDNMDLRAMATSLGLPETATEAEVQAALNTARQAQTDLATLRAETAQKEKEAKTARIKAKLDKAVLDKKITADQYANWEKMMEADEATAMASLDALEAVKKIDFTPSGSIGKDEKVTYKGKTFSQLQEEDPDILAELEKNDKETFTALFKSEYK